MSNIGGHYDQRITKISTSTLAVRQLTIIQNLEEQIKDIDMSKPELLAKTDAEMISTMSIANYFKYIFQTVVGKGQGDRVRR